MLVPTPTSDQGASVVPCNECSHHELPPAKDLRNSQGMPSTSGCDRLFVAAWVHLSPTVRKATDSGALSALVPLDHLMQHACAHSGVSDHQHA